MPERLKSRKLWAAATTVLVIVVQDVAGLDISSEAIYSIVGVVGAYVLGQGYADRGK